MTIIILQLLIAHVIGDFVIQPDSWVKDKNLKKHKSVYLYTHGIVHLIALLVLLKFEWDYWPYILINVLSHLVIDFAKLNLEGIYNKRLLFIVDQCLHLGIIALIAYYITPYAIDFEMLYSKPALLFMLAILSVTYVSSIIMKMLMSNWILIEDSSDDSLENAGKYIGILERLLVFGLIIMNQWNAIGLIIAAKSVFRFGDLSRAKDRKLTEYILIGTLTSFGLAIIIGLLYVYLLN